MKKIVLMALVLLIVNFSYARTDSGIMISITDSHKFIEFSNDGYQTMSGENQFSDFILKFTNISRNKLEINLVMNKSSGENVVSEFYLFNYDMTGYGIEVGKVISIGLFNIGNINVECEFTAGLFGMLYLKREIEKIEEYMDIDSYKYVTDLLKHQYGFYTTVRAKIKTGVVNLYLGVQSQLPIMDNTFSDSDSIHLFKSYLFAGISF